MSDLTKAPHVLDSREVAEMVGMRHADLMRSIDRYIDVMGKNAKLRSSNFFIERTYKQAGNGKEVKRYDITKKGCEMVANKLTGEKGILFTAEYVERFNQMEEADRQPKELKGRELMAKALIEAQAVLAEKDTIIAKQTQLIGELKPKADYTDRILQSKELVAITQIAKDYGMSGQAMNKKLHELGVIYKLGGQWLLYSKYQAKGYTHSETVRIKHSDGTRDVKMNTKWNQKGRLFLYEFLKKHGILPVIEQDHDEKPLLTIVG
ncbi:phage antirepressor KilAC domain-containing protein [uncultured Selenomonas sp.]|uniref:phage antirepressor KilAC domain-containing protein n=1 Tax=uncultured Selenomonas sp. TaxID=159275 RepID=UPI0028053F1A|nr:phage antirepressor KilAC domain-containing protein [uncultured Selenomonas sp.]